MPYEPEKDRAMPESTAEVFASYLGMTPENAGWAYEPSCPRCENIILLPVLSDDPTMGDDFECYSCDHRFHMLAVDYTLTATSPLAPAPTPGWLEVLVWHKKFNGLCNYRGNRFRAQWGDTAIAFSIHPTHAVARALVAADPALRARLEACGDWEEVK